MTTRIHSMAGRSGFTLVELLVVISIIALLMTLLFFVGRAVIGSGKKSLTQDTIRTLDAMVTAYQNEVDGKLPSFVTDAKGRMFPIIDAKVIELQRGNFVYDKDKNPSEPSLALFLLAAKESATIDAAIKGLNSKLVERGPLMSAAQDDFLGPMQFNGDPIDAITIKDGWGRPIRMVLPQFDGGYGPVLLGNETRPSVRRPPFKELTYSASTTGTTVTRMFFRSIRSSTSQPNVYENSADEGICVNNQPYFYSAGEDGDPGTRSDNVYTTQPTYPKETLRED